MHNSKFFLGALFIINCFIYFVQPDNRDGVIANWAYLLSTLAPTLFGFQLLREYGISSSSNKHVLFLWIGFLMFGIGNILWTVLTITSFPSPADAFFVLGYPFLLIGFYKTLVQKESLTKIFAGISWGKKIIAGILIGVILYFGVFITLTSGLDLMGTLTGITYNIGDIAFIIILLLLMQLASQMKGGKFGKVWQTFAMGIVLILIADVLYIFFNASYIEGVGSAKLIDLVWQAGYIGVALAFAYWTKVIVDAKAHVKEKLKKSA